MLRPLERRTRGSTWRPSSGVIRKSCCSRWEQPKLCRLPIATHGSRWTDITAVRTGRLHTIPSDIINRPGPRIVEALEAMIGIFHPGP